MSATTATAVKPTGTFAGESHDPVEASRWATRNARALAKASATDLSVAVAEGVSPASAGRSRTVGTARRREAKSAERMRMTSSGGGRGRKGLRGKRAGPGGGSPRAPHLTLRPGSKEPQDLLDDLGGGDEALLSGGLQEIRQRLGLRAARRGHDRRERLVGHRRVEESGADRMDGDALALEVEGHRAAET